MKSESAATISAEKAPVPIDSVKVDSIIRKSVYANFGVGIIPIPFVDWAGAAAVQLAMTKKLAAEYGVEFKEGIAKKIIATVVGAGIGVAATPLVKSLVIGIPIVGLPLAATSMPMMNALSTYAVGRMFVNHFEKGGDFVNVNYEVMKQHFKDAYANSREWLGGVVAGRKGASASAEPAV
jgi:uncharacterized protein (DUF697 family)